jgi:hypothetical protein
VRTRPAMLSCLLLNILYLSFLLQSLPLWVVVAYATWGLRKRSEAEP